MDKMTVNQAEDFVRACATLIGPGFHPDTHFDKYVDDEGCSLIMSASWADYLQNQLEDAFDLIDPYEIGLEQLVKMGWISGNKDNG